MKNNIKQFGFSLVEVLVALMILIMVVAAIASLSVGVIRTSQISKQEIQAYGYAQEQLELAKQIRNTNLIDQDKSTTWKTGLNSGVYYLKNDGLDWELRAGKDNVQSTVNKTRYKRWLEIDRTEKAFNEDIIKLTSVVTWKEKTRNREIRLVTYLTDWLWGYEN